MKLKVSSDSFSSPENLSFEEMKFFPAEDYKAKENKGFSFEKANAPESFEETKAKEGKKIKKDTPSNKIKDLVQKVRESSSMIASVSATAVVAVIGASTIGIIPDAIGVSPSVIPFKMNIDEMLSNSSPNELDLLIPISNINEKSKYKISLDQYSKDETFLTNVEANSEIQEGNILSITAPLEFGASLYKIRISYGAKEDFLSSFLYTDVSQEYLASYSPLSGKDVELTIKDEATYDINLVTGFNTDYPDIFSYKVEIYSNDRLIDSYKGNEPEITFLNISLEDVSTFSFIYYDLGVFNGKEHIYQEFDTSSEETVAVGLPKISFDEPTLIDDIYFLPCVYSAFSDEEELSLELEFIKEDGTVINFEETYINESIMLSLEGLGDNPGKVTLKTKINFFDTQNSPKRQSINLPERILDLSYTLSLTRVIADTYDSTNSSIPLHMSFDVKAPSTCNIRISDSLGNIISNSPAISDEIEVDGLSGDGGEVNIALYEKEGNKILELEPITILSLTEGYALKPASAYFNLPNPNDSYVTYNDDGTINIYRDMYNISKLEEDGLEEPPENFYYDTYIYHQENLDSGETVISNEFHNISRERVSIMEDLPKDDYIFEYYQFVENDGVLYKISKQLNSGSVTTPDISSFGVDASYDQVSNKTKVTIVSKDSIYLDSYIYLEDGTKYEVSLEDGTYTLDGNQIGKEIEFYASQYVNNKGEIPSLISVKGKEYLAYNITLTSA